MGLRAKGFLGLTVLQAGFVGKRVLGVNVSLRGSVFGDCCLYGDCCLFGDCCLVCLDVRDSLDETGFLGQFFADLIARKSSRRNWISTHCVVSRKALFD